MKVIGTAKVKDLDGALSAYLTIPYHELKSFDFFNRNRSKEDGSILIECWRSWFSIFQCGWVESSKKEELFEKLKKRKSS